MTVDSEPLLALPRGTDASMAMLLTASFILIFVIFYGGASYVSGWIPYRIYIDLPFEAAIPFVPQAAIVYLSTILFLTCAPFVLRRFRELFPFFVVVSFQTIIGAVIFVALPVEPGYPPRVPTGPMLDLFILADTLNLERNELPALHVAYAFTAAAAYRPKCSRWTGLALWSWAAAIGVSTMLMHEHHLIDMGSGILLAGLTMHTVYPRARRPAVLDRAEIELLCLREFARFARRHVRYVVICLALYRASLGRFWERRILRTGFCLLQSVDDLLDGDRPSEQEPLYVVDQLVQEIESRQFGSDPLSRLAYAFVCDLERIRNGRHDPLKDAVALIRHMQTDRRRVLTGNLMTEQQLREHHRRTFSLSVDLMLLAAGSPLRATDCPALIDAFGWCSTMRDLEEDLSNDLVNIPQEVVDRARDQGVKDLSFQSLCLSVPVRDWMKRELIHAEKLLDRADAQINAVGNVEGASTLSMFARSIRGYVRRYSRSLPGERQYRACSMEFVKERSPHFLAPKPKGKLD